MAISANVGLRLLSFSQSKSSVGLLAVRRCRSFVIGKDAVERADIQLPPGLCKIFFLG